jgi:large subunit ribosomal protein L28e
MQTFPINNLTWKRSYRTVVNSTAKRGYRPDLRQVAVARVSAIHNSQRQKKDDPVPKPRGAKAKAAASS